MLSRLIPFAFALISLAVAKPAFTNTDFDVVQGEPFTLRLTGCDGGCTIVLESGEASNLKDVKILTTSATSSYTVTLQDLPADTYLFKVVTNSGGDTNYSPQFKLAEESGGSASSALPGVVSSVEGDISSAIERASSAIASAASSATDAASTLVSPTEAEATATDTGSGAARSSNNVATSTFPSRSGTTSTPKVAPGSDTSPSSEPIAHKSKKISPGAIAGIVVGVVGGILIVVGALFFWLRRRKQKAKASGGDDALPHISELGDTKKAHMLDSKMLPAEMTGSTGPPPAELSGHHTRAGQLNKEDDLKDLIVEKDTMITAAELPGKETSPTSPSSELPEDTARYEMDSNQQPRSPPPILRKQVPKPMDDPELASTSPTSQTLNTPTTQVSPVQDSSFETMSPSLTEPVSLPSPSLGSAQTKEMLMQQYEQLEARRQRILELKKIEEEQAELQAQLKKMSQ